MKPVMPAVNLEARIRLEMEMAVSETTEAMMTAMAMEGKQAWHR